MLPQLLPPTPAVRAPSSASVCALAAVGGALPALPVGPLAKHRWRAGRSCVEYEAAADLRGCTRRVWSSCCSISRKCSILRLRRRGSARPPRRPERPPRRPKRRAGPPRRRCRSKQQQLSGRQWTAALPLRIPPPSSSPMRHRPQRLALGSGRWPAAAPRNLSLLRRRSDTPHHARRQRRSRRSCISRGGPWRPSALV
jgi:hypothetical protein